jgi:hypothetical protein
VTHEFNGRLHHKKTRTWTARRITVIIVVAFIYGIWFNFIDSLNYCYNDKNVGYACKSVGEIFGGDLKYQPWNIIGHIIPGLFMLFYFRSKKEELAIVELFLAGILISTATMDSPLWGAIRLLHGNPLWHCLPCEPPPPQNEPTTGPPAIQFMTWIAYYYNPVGSYVVWNPTAPFPSAALIFWSVVGRIAGAVILIVWQYRQEKKDAPISSLKGLVFRPINSNSRRK